MEFVFSKKHIDILVDCFKTPFFRLYIKHKSLEYKQQNLEGLKNEGWLLDAILDFIKISAGNEVIMKDYATNKRVIIYFELSKNHTPMAQLITSYDNSRIMLRNMHRIYFLISKKAH